MKRIKLLEYTTAAPEATGRQRFQRVWLWGSTNTGRSSTVPYDPTTDVSEGAQVLPGALEQVSADNAKEYLEVGIIFGKEPRLHLTSKSGKNKQRDAEREARGILRRDDSAMRVFTPITEYIPVQTKLYVGCLPVMGRLDPRTIQIDSVFIYPEFWEGVDLSESLKERRAAVMRKFKTSAAVNKTEAPRAAAPIAADQTSKKLSTHPLAVTEAEAEHIASTVASQWPMSLDTEDGEVKTLGDAQPDLKYSPTEGVSAFMEFGEPLEDVDAEKLKDELEAKYPDMRPHVDLIKQIHARLCRTDNRLSTRESKEEAPKIGDRLPLRGLGFFLDACHSMKPAYKCIDPDGNYNMTVLGKMVKLALRLTDVHVPHAPEVWTLSKTAAADEDEEMGEEVEEEISG